MALGVSELKKGGFIIIDGAPYVILSHSHSHIGRGGAVAQTKVRNLKTGVILDRNFKGGDSIKEAKISKMQAVFVYERRGEYWFHVAGKPANRFSIKAEVLEDKRVFLKPKMEVVALKFMKDDKGEIINVELPVKADYRVIEAPPGIRGSTAQGGTKTATLEGGLRVNVPFFIEEGDTVRINTETGGYAERMNK
ncbi:MAG: elongation factor P [Candidatus Colwellbacteria bacterium]